MRGATGIFWKCNWENSRVHSWACAKCSKWKVCKLASLGEIFMPKSAHCLDKEPYLYQVSKSGNILVNEKAIYVGIYSAWRTAEGKFNCFYCHFPGTPILTSALTWKISSGTIQFRQQKVVWLDKEAVFICLLSGFRYHSLHLLCFLVTPSSMLSCLCCCWPSATICGHLHCVLETKNLNSDSMLTWKVISSPFRWLTKTHSQSAFIRLYICGNYIFPHPSPQFIMPCLSICHPLKHLSNIM